MKTRMPPLKIRWKLIGTLSVPLLVLAFVVGAEVREQRADVRESSQTKELIELVQLAARVRNEVQVDEALTRLPQSAELSQQITRSRAQALADVRRLDAALAKLEPARFGPDLEESAARIA